MTNSQLRATALRTSRFALGAILLNGAQLFAPLPENLIFTRAQLSSKQGTLIQRQKVANPLNDLLDEARRDIDENNFEAAITPLQKVIVDQPEFAYAHFQLGYVYTALKKTDEARAEYQRTVALDPKMSEAYVNLGIILLDKDPAAALAPLEKAVELLPAQSRPRFLLGVAEERSDDLVKASESFESAVRLDPKDTETLLHLGNLYARQKRPADAESSFRRVLELQPNEPRALLGLAQTLEAQKKPEAVDAYRKYFDAEPSDTATRARFVQALFDAQDYDGALAELDRMDAGKPSLDSLKMRADIQIAQKKWDEAIITLQKVIALTPNDAQMRGGLGRIYLQKREFPLAEKELRLAIHLDGKNLAYWKDLSSTFFLGGNYPATLNTLDEIAKVEQPGAGTWFIRAICYDKLNQPRPALEAYQRFLQMDQDKNPDQVWQAQQRSKVLQRMLEKR
jgi:tetratricopeptide (TPR) repeat protein